MTTGIATVVNLQCKICNLNKKNIRRADYEKLKFRKDSAASFALNCQFVLGLQQSGCGAAESGTLLAFLDMPHSSTFHKTTFPRVESAMRQEIKVITDTSMLNARDEEIRETIGEEKFIEYKNKTMLPDDVKLTITYDMGWNKRSSGNKYDSSSGHGFVLGGRTQKVINHRCLSKRCSTCKAAENRCVVAKDHECPKNHVGSSKSMEVEAIFRMVKEGYYNHRYTCAVIVSDDDSTMKSNLKHSYKEKINKGLMRAEDWPKTKSGAKKTDNGRLPLEILEPSFLADFNHRVKTVGKQIYALADLPKRDSKVDTALAARVKGYWGAMLKQVRYLNWENDDETIVSKAAAPIEHLFKNHVHCCSTWCYVLKAQNENKSYLPDPQKPLFDKVVDFKMYEQLCSAVARFQTKKNILECLHKYDTQQNESLNMSVSRYVPKFKHFGTTMALDTRVRCVIGVRNLGYANFYNTLLFNLGCLAVSDGERLISQGISIIDKTKLNLQKIKKTLEYKRSRKHGKKAKNRQAIFEERVDRAQNLGTYQTGIGMAEEQESQPITRRQNTKICEKCGGTGHKTWRAKACLFHHEYIASKNSTNKNTNLIDNDNVVRNEISVEICENISNEVVTGDTEDGEEEQLVGEFAVTAKVEAAVTKLDSKVPNNENTAVGLFMQMLGKINKESKKNIKQIEHRRQIQYKCIIYLRLLIAMYTTWNIVLITLTFY